MTGERPHVLFDCPHCHEPFVSVANVEIDIHGGASYECDACERWVVFETFHDRGIPGVLRVAVPAGARRGHPPSEAAQGPSSWLSWPPWSCLP